MSDKLKRIISLAKKTGDRIVVFDNSAPDNSFVVMGLDQYEEMWGLNDEVDNNIQEKQSSYQQIANKPALTEEKITDRIDNSDKMWKTDNNFQAPIPTPTPASTSNNASNIENQNIYSSGQVLKNRFKNNNWQIPKSIKQAAEEVEGQE